MTEPRWPEVTALFGGTFDPPHEGHREALRGLFAAEPGVARVLVVPSASPPHKPTVANASDRIAMARLAFTAAKIGGPVEIRALEIERARARPDLPSYSFDTISELSREFPRLAFVIGADQLAAMAPDRAAGRPGWHRFPEILGLCHWLVLARRPDGADLAAETLRRWDASGLARPLSARGRGAGVGGTGSPSAAASGPTGSPAWELPAGRYLRLVQTPARAISSTAIREHIARGGRPSEGALDPEVSAYLMAHCVYGMTQSS